MFIVLAFTLYEIASCISKQSRCCLELVMQIFPIVVQIISASLNWIYFLIMDSLVCK